MKGGWFEPLAQRRLHFEYPTRTQAEKVLANLRAAATDRLLGRVAALRQKDASSDSIGSDVSDDLAPLGPLFTAWLDPVLADVEPSPLPNPLELVNELARELAGKGGRKPPPVPLGPAAVRPRFRQFTRGPVLGAWAPLVETAEDRLIKPLLGPMPPRVKRAAEPAAGLERLAWVRLVRVLAAWKLIEALDFKRIETAGEIEAAVAVAERAAELGRLMQALPGQRELESFLGSGATLPRLPFSGAALRQRLEQFRRRVREAQLWKTEGGLHGYVLRMRRAEDRLVRTGHLRIEDRAWIFTGIYYATPWSLDEKVEKSTPRTVAFRGYLHHSSSGPDPRRVLGTELFAAIQDNQDVSGIDMGHLMIGLYARLRAETRDTYFPGHEETPLEIVTWVGDLGGGAGALAQRRVSKPQTPVSFVFGKTDYGADSNLEGDLAAYLVAAPEHSARATAPLWPDSARIADALEDYFLKGGQRGRYRRFLETQGGVFEGRRLANRPEVRARMLRKIQDFAKVYITTRLVSKGQIGALMPALKLIPKAAPEVTDRFLDWLLQRAG